MTEEKAKNTENKCQGTRCIKQRLMDQGMKLLENKHVQAILASKRTEKVMEAGIQAASTIAGVATIAHQKTLDTLGLVRREEFEKMQSELKAQIEALKKEQAQNNEEKS